MKWSCGEHPLQWQRTLFVEEGHCTGVDSGSLENAGHFVHQALHQ